MENQNRTLRLPPVERVRELFHYDPHTGILTWKAGSRAGKSVGGKNSSGYLQAQFTIDGQKHRPLVHVIAWAIQTGEWPLHPVDHENHNPSDNRWGNLRPATHVENMQNRSRHGNNTSGTTGVYQDKRTGRWIAQIAWERTTYHLGTFETKEEAVECRRVHNIAYGFHPNHGVDLEAGEKPPTVIAVEGFPSGHVDEEANLNDLP